MAKKNAKKELAAAARRFFGAHDGAYAVAKKVGYFFIRLWRSIKAASPESIAYYAYPPAPPFDAGYVTRVDRRGISGVAFRSGGDAPAEVELRIDGEPINRTWASQKVQEPRKYAETQDGFFFPMKHVWELVSADQRIEVLAGGRPLRYKAGKGPGRPLPNRGAATVSGKGIVELVKEGHLINKFGRIQSPRQENAAWTDKAFGNYGKLNAIFEREFGKSLFVFYGTMLGFAREGSVLAHDLDLDLAYFSEESSPEKVKAEFRSVAERLIAAGVPVEPFTYKLQFHGSGLSVTPTFIAGGAFHSTFGYVGDGFAVARDDILPLMRAEHDGRELLLPRNPQAVAAYIYGKGWKYPDPGWKWLPEYKSWPAVLAARLSDKDVRELNALAGNGK